MMTFTFLLYLFCGLFEEMLYTVKPVHKDHSRDQQNVVSIDRGSLCKDATVRS